MYTANHVHAAALGWEGKTSLTFEYDSAMLILGFFITFTLPRLNFTGDLHAQNREGAFACYTAKRRG